MGVLPPAANLEWHQDGGGAEGTTKHMVLWACEMPTELKLSSGERFYTMPYDLVWIDNTRAYHRQPRLTDESTRWFCAIRCSGVLKDGRTLFGFDEGAFDFRG